METTTKRTYRDIIRFIGVAENWQQQNKKDAPLTSFKYAISRVLKGLANAKEDFTEEQTRINIECAAADEKGNILNDIRGNTMFTKEGAIKRNADVRTLVEKEVEAPFYFAKKIPDDLTPAEIDAFEGFVIPEIKEPVE